MDKPLSEIAGELNVDAVVEGSAQRVGDSVRVMAQLVDPETEQALWAESYEQDIENVLLVWSEVAQAIAGEVQVALTPEETNLLAEARPVNPEAHDAYLQGSYYWKTLRREDLDTAERYFNLALSEEPNYVSAYEGLAWVWACRQQMGITPPQEAGPKGKAAALQAIAMDDSSVEAYGALGVIITWTDWDWDGAGQAWRRALELDPNFADAHAYFAHFLAITGRINESVLHSERAIELDPFNALFHGLYAGVLHGARRYDDAIAASRTSLAMQPNLGVARHALERALFSKGMRDEHLAYQLEWFAGDPERVAACEQGLAEAGYEGAQRRIGDLLAARYEKSGSGPVPSVAFQYLYAGDYDRAMDWLEKGFEVRDPNMPYVSFEPLWDPLRADPRFQDLLRRMNLPLSTGEGR
jgi:tetratricopeptide (TPR) repeat protein